MRVCPLIVFIAVFCLALPASAGPVEIDRKRMQQDLGIMEGILHNLHAHHTPFISGVHQKPHVRGFYFENYGVIFLIEESRPPGLPDLGAIQWAREASGTSKEDNEVNPIRALQEERRGLLQDRLREFLGTYADAIRQLKAEDQITVRVHYQPVSPISFEVQKGVASESLELQRLMQGASEHRLKEAQHAIDPREQETGVNVETREVVEKQIDREALRPRRNLRKVPMHQMMTALSEQAYFEVTAKKRDIVAYRRERLSEAEFRRRMVSREVRRAGATMKKISVLAAILDKALTRPAHLVPGFGIPGRGNQTLGLYLEGLGAVFFVNAGTGYRAAHPLIKEKVEAFYSPTHPYKQGKPTAEERRIHDRFKGELVEVVGDYGYTLRIVKPNEYIVVEVRFPAGLWSGWPGPKGLVLKVQKVDVDAYGRGEVDLAGFRQKVDILEF